MNGDGAMEDLLVSGRVCDAVAYVEFAEVGEVPSVDGGGVMLNGGAEGVGVDGTGGGGVGICEIFKEVDFWGEAGGVVVVCGGEARVYIGLVGFEG